MHRPSRASVDRSLSHTQRHSSMYAMCAKKRLTLTIRGRLKLWEQNMMVRCMIRRRNGLLCVRSCRAQDRLHVECSSILVWAFYRWWAGGAYVIWKLATTNTAIWISSDEMKMESRSLKKWFVYYTIVVRTFSFQHGCQFEVVCHYVLS